MRVCKEIVRLSLANLFGRFLIKRPNWLDGPVRLGLYGIRPLILYNHRHVI